MIWLFLFVSVSLGAFGQILMKLAMQRAGHIPLDGLVAPNSLSEKIEALLSLVPYFWKALVSWPMISAVVCYGLSYVIWLGILSRNDLTFARPFVSFGYIIVILYGYYAGEAMSFDRVLGIGLIVAGLIFVAKSGS